MGLKVDRDYYENACNEYTRQIANIETHLEAAKTAFDGLFTDNYYGDNVQRVMMAKFNNFYNATSAKLSEYMTEVSSTTESFLGSIDTDDVLS